MCAFTINEILNSFPVMLFGDVLNVFENNVQDCRTYEGAIGILRSWSNRDDKKSRILTKWKTITLMQEMLDDTKDS